MPDDRPPSPLRLNIDGNALVANWRWLDQLAPTARTGAAVKADGYGLGAVEVVRSLTAAGCTDFYVATWQEAMALAPTLADHVAVSVLHGIRSDDIPNIKALGPQFRPVINTLQQLKLWRDTGLGWACDVMFDTGMNRLGLCGADIDAVNHSGITVDTLMSHLASADDDVATNDAQRMAFAELVAACPAAQRASLSNSAGICLGQPYHFDLTRPGLALYGGVPRVEAHGHIRQTVFPEAQVIQRRRVHAGQSVGYNGAWTAQSDTDVVIVNLGYADGYLRAFSNVGGAQFAGERLIVVGRVSMDLTALALPEGCTATEGDWIAVDFALDRASAQTGLSPYELLISLGSRYDRRWQ